MTKKKDKKSIKVPSYPRHSLEKALRIPNAILEQNAGKECTDTRIGQLCWRKV